MASRPALPTRLQALVSSFLLVALSLYLAPLTALVTIWARLTAKKPAVGAAKGETKRPTVMVNGGRMQKCLFVSRALAKQGFRVIVVEEEG